MNSSFRIGSSHGSSVRDMLATKESKRTMGTQGSSQNIDGSVAEEEEDEGKDEETGDIDPATMLDEAEYVKWRTEVRCMQ